MQDLSALSQLIQSGTDREVSSYYCDGVTMDEDYNDQRCSFDIDFDPEDEVRTGTRNTIATQLLYTRRSTNATLGQPPPPPLAQLTKWSGKLHSVQNIVKQLML
jgi:hypothetical protein